jgi:hypothetical protein
MYRRAVPSYQLFGHQRFLAQPGVGALPLGRLMHLIELLGPKVAPFVRRETISE